MGPPDPRCTIVTKIEVDAVIVASLYDSSRRYGANNKTRILVGTVIEV